MRIRLTASVPLALLTALLAMVATLFPIATSSAVAPSQRAVGRDRPAATEFVFVRPVTTAGRPAPGWKVRRERGSATCSGPSPSAVNPGIVSCFPTALALRACWKSAHHTVLCVRSARRHTLVRIHRTGRYPSVHAPAKPAPMNLVLADGRRCVIRDGGAWGAPPHHPHWIGFYSCQRHASVYGPARGRDGINRSHKRWTVRIWRTHQDDVVRRAVRTAYYVGTAAA
jgi:hypothetical protein